MNQRFIQHSNIWEKPYVATVHCTISCRAAEMVEAAKKLHFQQAQVQRRKVQGAKSLMLNAHLLDSWKEQVCKCHIQSHAKWDQVCPIGFGDIWSSSGSASHYWQPKKCQMFHSACQIGPNRILLVSMMTGGRGHGRLPPLPRAQRGPCVSRVALLLVHKRSHTTP
jgi:hypothetical protein